MSKVLIIEDELDILEMYETQFENADVDVIGCDNLKDGFILAKEINPDVILLDLLLSQKEVSGEKSGRGGCILLDELKNDPETKDIKVIIFSNLDTQEDRQEAFKRGAYAYLVKSEMVPKHVVSVVKEIMDGTRVRY